MRLSRQVIDAVQRLVTDTVNIATAVGPVASVRRLKSYSAPAVNDVVKVSRNPDGNWVVDGALA
jgi:hypothetical protein